MTAKLKAHTAQPSPTPTTGHTTSEAVGWTIGSLLILSVPLLFIAFWVTVIRYLWKRGTVVLLLLCVSGFGQSKPETIANFTARAFDAAQTCYYLHTIPTQREYLLSTQSCAGVAGYDAAYAVGAYVVDRWMSKHGHPRWAHFQLASTAGASIGIAYSFTHTR